MKYATLLLGDIDEVRFAHKQSLMKVLKHYLPARAVEYCSELIMLYKLHLHIEVERHDRLGDYHPHMGKGNRISINHNLNPYDFLITFAHELAHHVAYKKHGPAHQAHGVEWKAAFKDCLRPFVMMKIFPPDVELPLVKHMQKPKYTHSGDIVLMKALMKYDKEKDYLTLDELKEGALFRLRKNGRVILKKGALEKNWFICTDVNRNTRYRVSGIAKVFPVYKTQ